METEAFEVMQERVLRIVEKAFAPGKAPGRILTDQDLRDELGLESMALLSIAFRLESEFGLDLSEHGAEIAELRTVAQIARFLQQGPSVRA
ncbi:MAG: acyl carrier protein [Polyangiaceae bacterium]